MKKTLAIVLALVMVLCMVPVASAATYKTVSDKSYNIEVFSWDETDLGKSIGSASKANSVTAKYNYEDENSDVTGKFTEDKKMAIVAVEGFEAFESVDSITIDGKELEVNDNAKYKGSVGFFNAQVNFPVELTKAGYSDTYLIQVTGKDADQADLIEVAKVTVKLVNTSSYKNAKTATISKIKSTDDTVDAYIVGSKIYLDFVKFNAHNVAYLEVTFKDDNGSLFSAVTWATAPKKAITMENDADAKLKDSMGKYIFASDGNGSTEDITFKLETSSAIYETKEYDVVVRTGVKPVDPKGIYFAETSKTIKVGESYTPVVLGVATGKKINAKLDIKNTGADRAVLDLDGDDTVIGTKEGVTYITASYKVAGTTVDYISSSMKIIVTEGEIVADSTKYTVTCRTLNVRKGPGTSYAKSGKLSRGASVKVVEIANGWAKLDNGTYVCAKYISK